MAYVVNTPVDGINAIQDFLIDRVASIPTDIRDELRKLVQSGNSPVNSAVAICELIYARRDELPVELKDIGSQLGVLTQSFNFFGMAEGNRGLAIADTLKGKAGAVAPAPNPAFQKASQAPVRLSPAPSGGPLVTPTPPQP